MSDSGTPETTPATAAADAIAGGMERDRHIVDRVLGGDAEVYRLLVERYAASLVQYATYTTTHDDEVHAWVQEAFVRAFQAIKRIPQRGNFLPFALKAVRRSCFAAGPTVPLPLSAEQRTRVAQIVRDRQINSATLPVLRAALLAMPFEIREAFVLAWVTELSVTDAAYVSGTAVGVATQRGLQALRALERMASLPDGALTPKEGTPPAGPPPASAARTEGP